MFGRGARGLLTKGFDLGFHGVQTGLVRGDLELGRFAIGPGIFTDRLPEAVESLLDGGDEGFRRRQPHTSLS